MNTIEKFWNRVRIGGFEECWPWLGFKHYGYGQFRINHKVWQCHRLAYVQSRGSVPDALDVLHSCDNPPCCNPIHLSAGTKADNNADRHKKGRDSWLTGEQVYNAKLNDVKVKEMRRLSKEGFSYGKLAVLFNVSKSVAGRIVKREDWRHLRD